MNEHCPIVGIRLPHELALSNCRGLNKGTKKSPVYVVSGTPTRLLGTRHFSQTFLQEKGSVCKRVRGATPTRLLCTRHFSQTFLQEKGSVGKRVRSEWNTY